MKRFLLSAALLAAATTAIQAHTLDGIVKDNKTGEPLIGTVIRVKELPNVSTTTGLDGTFTLHELPDKGKFTIIVSYMSYKTKEMVVDVAKKEKVDIPMDEDLKQLGEVVVTGRLFKIRIKIWYKKWCYIGVFKLLIFNTLIYKIVL